MPPALADSRRESRGRRRGRDPASGGALTPFRAILVFYHVARLNSVAAAAGYLHVTGSAVTQQIRALESQLGTALVTRSGRKIRLTEAGERYFELIAADVEHILQATEQLTGQSAVTFLTIRATPTVATKWLLPRLPAFIAANPDLDIRLDGTNEPTDFSRDLVDIEIRHGTGGWPGLNVVPLAEEDFLPVCAPAFAAPGSLTPAGLAGLRLIQSVKAQVQWPGWFDRHGIALPEGGRRLWFDRSHMAVDAAAAGLGVALESTLMMERELAGGALVVPVAGVAPVRIVTQWLVCPSAHLRRRRVRRFMDWIGAAARDWRAAADAQLLSLP